MPEFLSYSFMQRAVAASFLIGLLCSVIGVYVVLRGISFIGAGTAHSAFAGVTLGFLLQTHPLLMALIFGLASTWAMHFLEQRTQIRLDVIIGVLYTFTMALAILFIGLMRQYNAEVFGYLFGSILSVTPTDLWVLIGLTVVVLAILLAFFKEFHFISFDPEMAEASGIPARSLSLVLLKLIALTAILSLKAVGALLVFALIVIPAAAAYQLAFTLRSMMLQACLVGIGSCLGGVWLSYQFELPSGATIVLVATTIFLLSVLFSPKRRRRAPLA